MRFKIITLSFLGVLILITIVLQLTMLGNYEEMVELEYDEFQIRIDYHRMAQEVLNLFHHEKNIRPAPGSTDKPPEEQDGDLAEQGELAPSLLAAPTAPVINAVTPIIKVR